MNSRTVRIIGAGIVVTGVLAAGCADARKERLAGAQRALAALPDVEVVSSDAAAGRITVRSRLTGALSTIDLQTGTAAAPAVAAASPPGAGGSGAQPVANNGAQPPVTEDGTEDGGPAVGAAARQPGDPADVAADAGTTVAAGTDAAPAAGELPVAAAPIAASATVVRDPQGRVQKIEGSGFSIERAPSAAGSPRAGAATGTAPVAAASAPAPATGERRRLNTAVVCGAGENRVLQGVELDVPGAGIVAGRGCSLTLANVRVRAGGWGLVVNPGATVRIDDSLVEGRTGALDLYPGGSLSAWATTFRGALGRPVATPQFVDRGGNSWD